MSDTEVEVKEDPRLKKMTAFQRFQRVIGRGLAIGLESNFPNGEPIELVKDAAATTPILDKAVLNKYDFKSGSQAMHVRHPATTNGTDLFHQLLLNPGSAETLRIIFKALPAEIRIKYQKLNIRQRADDEVLGLAFARFPVLGISEEKSAFHAIKEHGMTDGYLNLDCLSRSVNWNQLFVKYHLSVAPSLSANEFGYLKIDVSRDEDLNIVVAVSRAQESEVPDILKTAKTLPR